MSVLISQTEREQRRKEIIELYTERGLTLDLIGKRYGLTRERVRQIIQNRASTEQKEAVERRRPVVVGIGALLRRYRKNLKTQVELCAKAQIRQPNLCKIERGLVSPRAETVDRVAAALGLTPEMLSDVSAIETARLEIVTPETLTQIINECPACKEKLRALMSVRQVSAPTSVQNQITEAV